MQWQICITLVYVIIQHYKFIAYLMVMAFCYTFPYALKYWIDEKLCDVKNCFFLVGKFEHAFFNGFYVFRIIYEKNVQNTVLKYEWRLSLKTFYLSEWLNDSCTKLKVITISHTAIFASHLICTLLTTYMYSPIQHNLNWMLRWMQIIQTSFFFISHVQCAYLFNILSY